MRPALVRLLAALADAPVAVPAQTETPVYIGDTITAEAAVLGVPAAKPVCRLGITVTRQAGETALQGESWCYEFAPDGGR